MTAAALTTRAEQEAIEITQDLIRIDTSNYGDGSGPGEGEAAALVADLLAEVGYRPQLFESEPGRVSVLARIAGEGDGTYVVHGHTDVVPASAEDWSVDPFGAVIRDGMLWGRGAVDMKQMLGMSLAALRELARTGQKPKETIVFAAFADEEAGGRKGSHWMVDNHPEVFAGATHAISEVGGYSVTVRGRRVYLLQTAEKALAWMRLEAAGTAGHGSLPNRDNAVARLAGAAARVAAHEWPIQLTPTVRQLLDGLSRLTGEPYDPQDRSSLARLISYLGPSGQFVEGTLATGVNLTELHAGYKANVVPSRASASIDIRAIPGTEEEVFALIKGLAGEGVELEMINRDIGLEVSFENDFVAGMVASLQAEDPGAVVLPYMLSAGTDNKALSRLGIDGYGFTPMRLPESFDFAGMFHGVDERVPVDAVHFGTRCLLRLFGYETR